MLGCFWHCLVIWFCIAVIPVYVYLEKASDHSVQDVPLGFATHTDATNQKMMSPALLRWKNTIGFRNQEAYRYNNNLNEQKTVWDLLSKRVSPLPTCCPHPGWRPSSRVAPPSLSLPLHRCRPAACLTGRQSKVRQGFYIMSNIVGVKTYSLSHINLPETV